MFLKIYISLGWSDVVGKENRNKTSSCGSGWGATNMRWAGQGGAGRGLMIIGGKVRSARMRRARRHISVCVISEPTASTHSFVDNCIQT